jgi:hypothetical protein
MAEVVARLGCSAQARSYRDKPRLPAVTPCEVKPMPVITRKTFARQVFHPVPIALGEICKLCQIDGSAGIGDLEPVSESCRVAMAGLRTTDTPALASPGCTSAGKSSCVVVLDPVFDVRLPRAPKWEVIKPSVVIRRRPQRPHPSGSVLRSAKDY